MPAEMRLLDEGTAITIEMVNQDGSIFDISDATGMAIKFKKPVTPAVVVQKTAVHATDGTDGKMHYVSEAGFIDTLGDWIIQGYVQKVNGRWHSRKDKLTVTDILEET